MPMDPVECRHTWSNVLQSYEQCHNNTINKEVSREKITSKHKFIHYFYLFLHEEQAYYLKFQNVILGHSVSVMVSSITYGPQLSLLNIDLRVFFLQNSLRKYIGYKVDSVYYTLSSNHSIQNDKRQITRTPPLHPFQHSTAQTN